MGHDSPLKASAETLNALCECDNRSENALCECDERGYGGDEDFEDHQNNSADVRGGGSIFDGGGGGGGGNGVESVGGGGSEGGDANNAGRGRDIGLIKQRSFKNSAVFHRRVGMRNGEEIESGTVCLKLYTTCY